MKTPSEPRASTLKLAALALAAAVTLLCVAALTAPAPSSAAPPDPAGTLTVRAGNYIGSTTAQTFTLEKQVFAGSTDCTGAAGPVVTVGGIDQATGHSLPLAPADSVLLTVPQSQVGFFFSHVSEQNGPFVSWFPDAATQPLATYLPGPGNRICLRGPADADAHNVTANFYAGIELLDSCGNERFVFRPGETIQIRVTGGLTHNAEPHRLQAAGGSANECTFIPEAPAFNTVHVNADPFVYTFTLPDSDSDILPSCASGGTQHITGDWRVVTYDVPGCGCNRNQVNFKVQADAPAPSCPLAGCPADVSQAAAADSCGASVNFTPPAGAPGETVTCDRAPGSLFPVGTTEVRCVGSLGGECAFDVTVTDGTAPAVTPPANVLTGADAGACSASIDPGTAAASDNCAASVQGARDDAQPLGAPYPLGTTTITWTATDASGNTSSAQQTVTVVDDDPPQVSGLSASPSVLWPPDHTMRDVSLSYAATDNCAPVVCSVAGVTSNEPPDGTGDGDTAPDFDIVGPTLVRLRAERSGRGAGRQYTITLACSDGTNSATKSVFVNVPKSQKK